MSIAKPPTNLFSAIRTLSLDIVLGVLAVSYYFTSLLDIHMPPGFWFSLGSFVWFVYLADHLADSHLPGQYSNKEEVKTLRSYRKILGRCIILTLIIFLPSLFFLPGKIILYGLGIGLFVVGYLLINQMQNHLNRSLFPREVIISILYIAGTAGPPLLVAHEVNLSYGIALLSFLSLIFTNTLIFSYIDFDEDTIHGIRSLAVVRNPKRARISGYIFVTISMAGFSYLYYISKFGIHGLLGMFMCVVLLILLILIKRIPHEMTGVLADGILVLPFILLYY